MTNRLELTGQRFSRLTVLGVHLNHGRANPRPRWWVKCECGTEYSANGAALRRGEARQCKQCGYKSSSKKLTTGRSERRQSRTNAVYQQIKQQSRQSRRAVKPRTIYDETLLATYSTFISVVGFAPSDTARIRMKDKSLGYVPGNLYWMEKNA